MDSIKDKIRKLLALANDKGATEHEAQRAMEFASALMLKHGIEVEHRTGEVGYGDTSFDLDKRWKLMAAQAAGELYGCRVVINRRNETLQFVGRDDNVAVAEETFGWLCEQIERLYKVFLPKGMTKSDRAEYRRTFKDTCAIRVYQRCAEHVETMKANDAQAMAATGSRALVVLDHRNQLDAEINDFFAQAGVQVKKARRVKRRVTQGTIAGMEAANQVRIQRSIK